MSVGLKATGDYQSGIFNFSPARPDRNIGALQFLFAEFLDVFSELKVYVLDGFGRPGSIAHHDHWAIAAVFQLVERSPGEWRLSSDKITINIRGSQPISRAGDIRPASPFLQIPVSVGGAVLLLA